MEYIYQRRSIRRFRKQEISEKQIMECIRAGMNAPSAGNEQPWQFVVLNDRTILDKIPSFHPHSKMLLEAPAAILVCADMQSLKYDDYWIQDCSAATQNILLSLVSLNLGGVWLGVYPRKERVIELKKLLQLPDHIIPFSLIALGHPAEEKPPNSRFNQEKIHINSW